MPDFAQADPRQFWEAADQYERANGRTYSELQIALPRELSEYRRVELARAAARQFLGSSFAYTLAIHNPEAADKNEQPHFHLMWSERTVNQTTRAIPAERFFKRNGAKKDRKWNGQNIAEDLRVQWADMMNEALEKAGVAQRVDPRSLLDQGRVVEALLVEPKMLRRGTAEEKKVRQQEIEEIREAKAVLAKMEIAAPDTESIQAADQASQEKMETAIAEIEQWEAEELSMLDRAIEALKNAARTAATKVKAVLSPRSAAAVSETQPELPPAPDPAALQEVISWVKQQPDGGRLLNQWSAERVAKTIDEAIQEWGGLNHPDAPQMKANWEYVRSILVPQKVREQAERVKQLQKLHPDEEPGRIRLAAQGFTLKPPLGAAKRGKAERWKGNER